MSRRNTGANLLNDLFLSERGRKKKQKEANGYLTDLFCRLLPVVYHHHRHLTGQTHAGRQARTQMDMGQAVEERSAMSNRRRRRCDARLLRTRPARRRPLALFVALFITLSSSLVFEQCQGAAAIVSSSSGSSSSSSSSVSGSGSKSSKCLSSSSFFYSRAAAAAVRRRQSSFLNKLFPA